MKKFFYIFFIFILHILSIHTIYGQKDRIVKTLKQQDFEKNKIFDQTYNLWKFNNKWIPKKNDTLPFPYFVDDRKYKGLINYGLEFRSKDFRTFNYWENLSMFFLKVEIEKAKFNAKDSLIEIEGYISGGWGDHVTNSSKKEVIENTIDLFLGEKTDTIMNCNYSRIVNEEFVEVKLNNYEINESTILDSFPAFYFQKSKHIIISSRGRRSFKIKGNVTINTILAIGGQNCYAEIYDIGTMVYNPKKNKKIKKKNNLNEYKNIIVKNELVSEKKDRPITRVTSYYDLTEKAENYIIRNQFAQAKHIYIQIESEYSNIYTRDINNAVRCAILSRDLKTAFLFAKKLATKGIEINFFNSRIFQPMKRNSEWKNFYRSYDSILNLSKSKWNVVLKNQLQQLLDEDQEDYGLENRKEPKVLFETTERVTEKLIVLLQNEGYPSEEKIGVFTKNDTILIQSPDYNVLIRHAVQQKPKGLLKLMQLLDKSAEMLEYDKERSNNHKNFPSACLQIYKGNLYNNKSCNKNEILIKKIQFIFNNPFGFIIDSGDYIITEYNKENPENYDNYYNQNFNLVLKLTDDWEFYEKY